MRVTAIHGISHKGSTYHMAQLVLQNLKGTGENEVTEFFLPHDLPHFCTGCFSCFLKGEAICPHAAEVAPIAAALDAADIIVLTSPAYVCDMSGSMKALLDHFAYRWMPHRPEAGMFRKTGLVVASAAGAGSGSAAKAMKKNLSYWGVRRVFSFPANIGAMRWQDVKPERRAKLERRAAKLARKITKSLKRRRPHLFTRVLFWAMRGMQKGNDWNPADRDHWQRQGWLDGKRPF